VEANSALDILQTRNSMVHGAYTIANEDVGSRELRATKLPLSQNFLSILKAGNVSLELCSPPAGTLLLASNKL
jgi:hypothetical protein